MNEDIYKRDIENMMFMLYYKFLKKIEEKVEGNVSKYSLNAFKAECTNSIGYFISAIKKDTSKYIKDIDKCNTFINGLLSFLDPVKILFTAPNVVHPNPEKGHTVVITPTDDNRLRVDYIDKKGRLLKGKSIWSVNNKGVIEEESHPERVYEKKKKKNSLLSRKVNKK